MMTNNGGLLDFFVIREPRGSSSGSQTFNASGLIRRCQRRLRTNVRERKRPNLTVALVQIETQLGSEREQMSAIDGEVNKALLFSDPIWFGLGLARSDIRKQTSLLLSVPDLEILRPGPFLPTIESLLALLVWGLAKHVPHIEGVWRSGRSGAGRSTACGTDYRQWSAFCGSMMDVEDARTPG